MKFRTLSLYADFLRLFRKMAVRPQNYVTLGDMRLSFKLLRTSAISAEAKLIYAYLFLHRLDNTGVTIPDLSCTLGIPPALTHEALRELQGKRHINLIATQPNHDTSALIYFYNIANPAKYGMLHLEDHS